MRQALIAVLLLVALSVSAAAQASFGQLGAFYLPDDEPTTILLVGEITPATPFDLNNALRKRPGARKLVLASPGGNVYAALTMAQEIFDRGLATEVPEKLGCYSACAFVFFAGRPRQADGELGVHQISGSSNFDVASAQYTVSDIIETLAMFDVSPAVIATMFRTSAGSMYVFSPEELRDFAINTVLPEVVRNAPEPVRTSEPAHQSETFEEGVTVVAKSNQPFDVMPLNIPITEASGVTKTLVRIGFTDESASAAADLLAMSFPDRILPAGSDVKVLFGRVSAPGRVFVPYRLSVYDADDQHKMTIALSDQGRYVPAVEPFSCDPTYKPPPSARLQDRCP